MTDATEPQAIVACCKPLPAQHASNGLNHATRHATPVQRPSLKALALLTLGRNNARNTHATNPENTRNNEAFSEVGLLRVDDALEAILAELGAHGRHDIDVRRRHLHALADASGIPAAIVDALPDDDVTACEGWPDPWLTYWLRLREQMTDPAHVAACPWCSSHHHTGSSQRDYPC